MTPDDLVRLRHIVDALSAAIGFVQGRQREDLDDDQMLLFALMQAIQIVGEAASKISAELRDRHADIPWINIIGMRNRLVHAYFDINRDILWTTVTQACPELLAQIKPLLDESEN